MDEQKYKILVFDIDGTLLNSSHKVNIFTLEAIKKAKLKNYVIVFCSGRPFVDIINLQKQTNIADYIVCNNGTYFYDVKKNQFHFKNQIDASIVKEIISHGKKYCALLALHTSKNTYRSKLCDEKNMPYWFHDALDEEKLIFFDKYNFPLSKTFNQIQKNPITQIAFRLDKINARKLYDDLFNVFKDKVNIVISSEVYVDANPLGVNKFTGLKYLCDYIKEDVAKIVAFGDSNNDLEMLKNVGYGVCMGNGTEEAKLNAKEVIGDNDSKAIALKIQQILDSNKKRK